MKTKRLVSMPWVLVAVGLLIFSQSLIWLYAPVEQTLGLVQKIFYLHLPLAWWGFVSFFIVFLASIVYLWKGNLGADQLAEVGAELGVLCSTLVLGSGMLWARASWNTWWTWDPRLTTTLIMWFVYVGYLLLRKAFPPGQRQRRMASVLGIVAFVDVPLVFFSIRLWRSIHPAVLANKGGGMPPEMLQTLLVSIVAWGIFFFVLLGLRMDQVRLQARMDRIISGL